MQTQIIDSFKQTPQGREADRILRSCVHCGFCTATCPTYQLLGDELDGPRGRIYLIKQVLEGKNASYKTLSHLDRCLTCRSCETTCPSGVEYARLLDIGRQQVESQVSRPLFNRVERHLLHWVLSHPKRFATLHKLSGLLKPLLPKKYQLPTHTTPIITVNPRQHERFVILLPGCVQPTLDPNINSATEKVLDKLGLRCISLPETTCCGAISHHANKHKAALKVMEQNIDAWWPYLADPHCEAIVSNASGCGITLKDYAKYFKDDPRYADKAQAISDKVRDISEVVSQASDLNPLKLTKPLRVALHPPCTLQHGLKLKPTLEQLLVQLGFELLPVQDSHLCCGSAGTYSILQPKLSTQLQQNKLHHLQQHQPSYIVTANIGCQHHLQAGTDTPVQHWVETLATHLS